MFRTILAAAFLVAGGAAAQAQGTIDPIRECGRAYVQINDFQGKAQQLQAGAKGEAHWLGLGAYVANFSGPLNTRIDFMSRAVQLQTRYPKSFNGGGVLQFHDETGTLALAQESLDGEILAEAGAKDLYAGQYALFAKVRVCDVYHNFTPVLASAPSPDQIAADRKRRAAAASRASDDRREARIAALNDVECAVRFLMAAQMVPAGPARDAMNSRVGAPAGKFSAGIGTEDVFRTNVQRTFTERAQAFQKQEYKVAELIEDVGVCERKYNLPPSGLKAN